MLTNKQYKKWIQKGEPARNFSPKVIVYSEMAVRAAIIRTLKDYGILEKELKDGTHNRKNQR